jgi:3-phytase
MTFGPRLRDGRRTLLLVSDNNFAATQFTQFLLFAYDD